MHQTIELVEDDEVVLRGNFGSKLTLPERPVTAVTAVEIDDGHRPRAPLPRS